MQNTLKPYLINAFYSWCMDVGYTPLIGVQKFNKNHIPPHLEHNTHIVFNIHPKATRNFIFGKDKIEFETMCEGNIYEVSIDYKSIFRIYNTEENYGLDFDIDPDELKEEEEEVVITKPKFTLIKNESLN